MGSPTQVANELREGRLKTVLRESSNRPPPPIQLVYPAARLLSAKVRTFVIDTAAERTNRRFSDF